MGRVDGQGREHGPDFVPVIPLHPFQVRRVQFGDVEDPNPVFCQRRHQFVPPAAALVRHHAADPPDNGAENLRRRETVQAAFHYLRFDLLFQSGNPDFEEFVEVRGGNAEEFQLFEKRIGSVERLLEDTLVELQPAHLAIEKMLWFERVDLHTKRRCSLRQRGRFAKLRICDELFTGNAMVDSLTRTTGAGEGLYGRSADRSLRNAGEELVTGF